MAGDRETGVMVMRMEEGLDTGPVAMAERVPIGPDATAGDLHDELARVGADLMAACALGALERGLAALDAAGGRGRRPTRRRSTRPRRASTGRKPWQQVHDHIRGLSPFPGAWCELAGAGRVKVLRTDKRQRRRLARHACSTTKLTIACGEGAVRSSKCSAPASSR